MKLQKKAYFLLERSSNNDSKDILLEDINAEVINQKGIFKALYKNHAGITLKLIKPLYEGPELYNVLKNNSKFFCFSNDDKSKYIKPNDYVIGTISSYNVHENGGTIVLNGEIDGLYLSNCFNNCGSLNYFNITKSLDCEACGYTDKYISSKISSQYGQLIL